MLFQFSRCQHTQDLSRELPPSLQAIQDGQLPSLSAFRYMWDSPAFCSIAELPLPPQHGTQAGIGKLDTASCGAASIRFLHRL
jgi:hypothetical protein